LPRRPRPDTGEHADADIGAAALLRGRGRPERSGRQQADEILAQAIDPCLQAVIEHVADHGHAAGHPLPRSAQLGQVELRHGAVIPRQFVEQHQAGILRDPVPATDVGKRLVSIRRQTRHEVAP